MDRKILNFRISENFMFDEVVPMSHLERIICQFMKERGNSQTAIEIGNFILSLTIPEMMYFANLTLNARNLALKVLQPLRDYLNTPIIVNSWYRSISWNGTIGGSKNSDHLEAEAADVTFSGIDQKVRERKFIGFISELDYHQIIYYPEKYFLHLSSRRFKPNHKQLLAFNEEYQYIDFLKLIINPKTKLSHEE